MATRRTRIKGIANIPQRKKTTNTPLENIDNVVDNPEAEILVEQVKEVLPAPVNDAVPEAAAPVVESIPAVEPTPAAEPPKLLSRRAFIKPSINVKLLSQKPKIKPLERVETPNEARNSNEDPQNGILPADHMPEKEPMVNLPPSNENTKIGVDNEYPPAPPSPTKVLNRSRIKVAPRLGQRRPSQTVYGSASESEDETKKNYNKRVRTESACSTTSVSNSEHLARTEPASPQKKEFSTIIMRKCKRTEQSRKMAEARRHFLHKFGNKTPDKQKLTMLDLIFYNPTTNPMSQKQKRDLNSVDENVKVDADDPLPMEETNKDDKSDEEDDLPAPQIKIGANGEIVIDEKSLVIENAETKKGRAELQKSKLIDGDLNTTYGIYKRQKRSKDWSKEETLRFYKALNTLGTDFTLMVELFHGRNRRELKMKFKKEERVNRILIDRALTQPVQFDITELREEARKWRWKMEQIEKAKEPVKIKDIHKSDIGYRGKARLSSLKRGTANKSLKPKIKHEDLYSQLEKGIKSVGASDADPNSSSASSLSSLSSSSSEGEEETPPSSILKQTRSGRIPKQKEVFDNSAVAIPESKEDGDGNGEAVETTDDMTDLANLQPGTIMIVSSRTVTGEDTFKVFMVTPGQAKVPIDLTPDMMDNLIQSGMIPNELLENFAITADESNVATPIAQGFDMTIPKPQDYNNDNIKI